MKLTKKYLWIAVLYVLALILGFVGAPKMTFVTGLVAWAIFTAVYVLIVLAVKKIYEGSKKQ